MEEIDEQLSKYDLPPISDVVNNKEKCIRYINKILLKYGNKVLISDHLMSDKYDYRVKHVLFSFGLGVVFASFCNLRATIEHEYERYKIQDSFIYAWLTLCLYHDYGYFIGAGYLRTEKIQELRLDHYIFEYHHCTSRYSKELYEKYYEEKYANQNWDKNDYYESEYGEVGDHGILGGYLLFQQLCSSEIKQKTPKKKLAKAVFESMEKDTNIEYHPERIPFYQDICYRIMEHNIWKKQTILPKCNPLHMIDLDNFNIIDIDEPLLFLLSLVDTIEMTKKFCQYIDDSSEKKQNIYPKTLASKINICVNQSRIEIDYSGFEKHIKKYKKAEDIKKWEKDIGDLINWVSVDIHENNKTFIIKKLILPNE